MYVGVKISTDNIDKHDIAATTHKLIGLSEKCAELIYYEIWTTSSCLIFREINSDQELYKSLKRKSTELSIVSFIGSDSPLIARYTVYHTKLGFNNYIPTKSFLPCVEAPVVQLIPSWSGSETFRQLLHKPVATFLRYYFPRLNSDKGEAQLLDYIIARLHIKHKTPFGCLLETFKISALTSFAYLASRSILKKHRESNATWTFGNMVFNSEWQLLKSETWWWFPSNGLLSSVKDPNDKTAIEEYNSEYLKFYDNFNSSDIEQYDISKKISKETNDNSKKSKYINSDSTVVINENSKRNSLDSDIITDETITEDLLSSYNREHEDIMKNINDTEIIDKLKLNTKSETPETKVNIDEIISWLWCKKTNEHKLPNIVDQKMLKNTFSLWGIKNTILLNEDGSLGDLVLYLFAVLLCHGTNAYHTPQKAICFPDLIADINKNSIFLYRGYPSFNSINKKAEQYLPKSRTDYHSHSRLAFLGHSMSKQQWALRFGLLDKTASSITMPIRREYLKTIAYFFNKKSLHKKISDSEISTKYPFPYETAVFLYCDFDCFFLSIMLLLGLEKQNSLINSHKFANESFFEQINKKTKNTNTQSKLERKKFLKILRTIYKKKIKNFVRKSAQEYDYFNFNNISSSYSRKSEIIKSLDIPIKLNDGNAENKSKNYLLTRAYIHKLNKINLTKLKLFLTQYFLYNNRLSYYNRSLISKNTFRVVMKEINIKKTKFLDTFDIRSIIMRNDTDLLIQNRTDELCFSEEPSIFEKLSVPRTIEEFYEMLHEKKPIAAVTGMKDSSEICSCNYLARSLGVTNMMPISYAKKICPHIELIPLNEALFPRAEEASWKALELALHITDNVEGKSCDEFVMALPGGKPLETYYKLAESLRQEIYYHTKFCVSVGIANSRVGAKLALTLAKKSIFESSIKQIENTIEVKSNCVISPSIKNKEVNNSNELKFAISDSENNKIYSQSLSCFKSSKYGYFNYPSINKSKFKQNIVFEDINNRYCKYINSSLTSNIFNMNEYKKNKNKVNTLGMKLSCKYYKNREALLKNNLFKPQFCDSNNNRSHELFAGIVLNPGIGIIHSSLIQHVFARQSIGMIDGLGMQSYYKILQLLKSYWLDDSIGSMANNSLNLSNDFLINQRFNYNKSMSFKNTISGKKSNMNHWRNNKTKQYDFKISSFIYNKLYKSKSSYLKKFTYFCTRGYINNNSNLYNVNKICILKYKKLYKNIIKKNADLTHDDINFTDSSKISNQDDSVKSNMSSISSISLTQSPCLTNKPKSVISRLEKLFDLIQSDTYSSSMILKDRILVSDCLNLNEDLLKQHFGEKLGKSYYTSFRGKDTTTVIPNIILYSNSIRTRVSSQQNFNIRHSSIRETKKLLKILCDNLQDEMELDGTHTSSYGLTLKIRKPGAPEPYKDGGHGICDTKNVSVRCLTATYQSSVFYTVLANKLERFFATNDLTQLRGLGVFAFKLNCI